MLDASELAPRKQFSLRYLFFITTSVAIGAWMVSLGETQPFLVLTGIGVFAYWAARVLFVLSDRVHAAFGWLVLFNAVLLYAYGVSAVLFGILFFTIQRAMQGLVRLGVL